MPQHVIRISEELVFYWSTLVLYFSWLIFHNLLFLSSSVSSVLPLAFSKESLNKSAIHGHFYWGLSKTEEIKGHLKLTFNYGLNIPMPPQSGISLAPSVFLASNFCQSADLLVSKEPFSEVWHPTSKWTAFHTHGAVTSQGKESQCCLCPLVHPASI